MNIKAVAVMTGVIFHTYWMQGDKDSWTYKDELFKNFGC